MSGFQIDLPDAVLEQLAQRVADILEERATKGLGRTSTTGGRWLTVDQAATYIGSRPQRVYDLRSSGRLTRHGDGARALVDKHELERWRVAEQDAAEARAAQRPSVPAALRAYVIARDASRCHLCGQKCRAGDIHLDHVIPYSLDGETTAANLRVSHSWCNLRKHTRASYEQLMVIG